MRFVTPAPLPDVIRDRYTSDGLWDGAQLRAAMRHSPGRTALVDEDSTWSYGRLDDAIARATGYLAEHGTGPGSAVLVIAPLSAPSVVAYHAIIRAGAVAVMLDRRCGRADVEHAVAAAGVRLIIAPHDTALLPDAGPPVVTFGELVAFPRPQRDWPEPDPRAPAALVFTSGTTSRPKGVLHSLDTLRAGARNMAHALSVTAADAAFLSTPIASITGLVQAHLMLDRGGTLVLEDRFRPDRSLDRVIAHDVTVLGGAPVILEQLLAEARTRDLSALPLRSIALGGAMIPRPLLELAVRRYGIRPVRMYGSSEVPCATATAVEDQGDRRVADDGCCAPGTELRTDESTGELLVRGPMRCLGYLDESDTADAFTTDGWFRTGDLGRVTDDRLTVTGRLKEVVSRKGMKISLAEIDVALASLPGAAESAAFGVRDAETGERLAVAVRTADPDGLDFDTVVRHLLAAGLAKWKLPEQIVLWDEPLPRTPSGKVQRRFLADDHRPRRTLLADRLRPRGDRAS